MLSVFRPARLVFLSGAPPWVVVIVIVAVAAIAMAVRGRRR
jgi:hypothetical protein